MGQSPGIPGPVREEGQSYRLSLIIPHTRASGGDQDPEVCGLTSFVQSPTLTPTPAGQARHLLSRGSSRLPARSPLPDPGLFLLTLNGSCWGQAWPKVTSSVTAEEPNPVLRLLAPVSKRLSPHLLALSQLQVSFKKPLLQRKRDRPS